MHVGVFDKRPRDGQAYIAPIGAAGGIDIERFALRRSDRYRLAAQVLVAALTIQPCAVAQQAVGEGIVFGSG
ncbi:MAG: hypothetical protein DI582_11050 [Azospirillum brasilense]|nr:MAG: hypothetical protein DI582_11050 [Azospirillum brasilense]